MSEKRLEVIARLRDEMSGTIKTIDGNMARMAAATEAHFARVNRTMNMVKGTIMAVAGSTAVKAMTEQAAAVERYGVQLNALLGSEEKAQAALARIREFVAKSPLDTDEVVQAFVQLEAVGVRSADKITEKLGNVAVIFNRDLRDVVSGFVSGGTEVLRRLGVEMSRSGDTAVMKSGEIRMAVANTTEDIRNGLLEIWEKRFPNAMELATSTFSAKMATFRSNVSDTVADIGTAFLPAMKGVLDQANTFIEQHRSDIVAVANSTGEILGLTADFIVKKLDATIFSTEFWARLPILAESAFVQITREFLAYEAVWLQNWTAMAGAMAQAFRTVIIAAVGGAMIAAQKLVADGLEVFDKLASGGTGTDIGRGWVEGLRGWISREEGRLQSGLNSELKALIDDADAALGLVQAQMERWRLDRGGDPAGSLLESGMSMAVESTGLDELAVKIQAVVDKNRAAAEEARAALEGVETGAGAASVAVEGAGNKAAGAMKKAKTAAVDAADSIRDAFQEIEDRLGPAVDLARSTVDLRQAQVDQGMNSGRWVSGSEQDRAAEAVRAAQRQELNAQMAVAQAQMGVLGGQPGQETAVAALAADVETLRVQLAGLNAESASMRNPWTAFNAGIKDGLTGLEMTDAKWRDFADTSLTQVADGLRNGIVDNVLAAQKGMQSWGDAGKQVLAGLLESIQKVIMELVMLEVQQAALDAAKDSSGWVSDLLTGIAGAVGGAGLRYEAPALANGALVSGGLRAIPHAAMGAVFRGPQLAVVGDNASRVEAAVPMPNGREIPVDLKGGGRGDTYHVSIQALDARSVRDLLVQEEGVIVGLVQNAVSSRPNVRRAIRGE